MTSESAPFGSAPRREIAWRAWLLMGLLLSGYSLVYVGDNLATEDEMARILTTDNLFHGRGFRVGFLDDHGQWQPFKGKEYSRYGFLHPLLALPLRAAAALFPGSRSTAAAKVARFAPAPETPFNRVVLAWMLWFSPLVTALCALTFYFCVLRLGGSPRLAFALSAGLGFSTIFLPYVQDNFTEPVTALLLLQAYFHALGRRPRDAAWCGLFAGLLPSNNVLFLLALPVFAIAVAVPLVRREWRRKALYFAGGAAPGLLFLGYQLVVRGAGYGDVPTFATPLAVGLFGLLLSPGKSVFVYSPLLLVAVAGFPAFLRESPRAARLALALTLIFLVVYAQWFAWAGGTCWGPRFLLPLTPLALLGALPILKRYGSLTLVRKAGIVVLAAGGLWIQLSSAIPPKFVWFHYAWNNLGLEMRDNRYKGKIDDFGERLVVFQGAVACLPEYWPPYIQTMALVQGVAKSVTQGFSPLWIRHRLWAWGVGGAVLAVVFFLGGMAWRPRPRSPAAAEPLAQPATGPVPKRSWP
ncbi:MAG: hypothetical protein NTW86_27465 [Candidatus Sumerlaeota bacterium]|nr:hypothetical protein [Candidatus Sumerlaeota bacterium]